MKRTFIAIKIFPDQVLRQQIQGLKTKLTDEKIYWLREQDLHVTLYFVGNTSEEQEFQIAQMLDQFTKEIRALNFTISHFNTFNRKGKPKILFAEVVEDTALQQVVASLWKGLAALGFSIGTHSYKPHVTIARIGQLKNQAAFDELVGGERTNDNQKIVAREVHLFQSLLSPEGSVYEPIQSFIFRGR